MTPEEKYGNWTVKSKTGRNWLCVCVCGKERVVDKYNLIKNKSRSCGCSFRPNNNTHGLSKTKEYKVWCEMRNRASNPEHPHAEYYFDKGVTCCDEWNSFERFMEDMGPRPEGTWLERVDNDKPYCKENCKWETPSRQCSNRGRKTNSSGRLGVYFDSQAERWRVLIRVDGRDISGGRHLTFEAACEVVEQLELKHLGYSRKDFV